MTVVQLLGFALLAAAAVRAATAARGPIERELADRRRRTLAAERLRQRVEQARQRYLAWRNADLAWQGLREFVVVRCEREDHDRPDTPTRIRSLYLAPRDGVALPPFQPGQYLTLHLSRAAIAGARRDDPGASDLVDAGPDALRRCYSLSDLPRPDYYRITVKRSVASRDDGTPSASHYLTTLVDEGTVVNAEAPRGGFVVDATSSRPRVFIAGGIGIAPIVCMLRGRSGAIRPSYLFYSTRHAHESVWREQLERLTKTDALSLHTTHAEPDPSDNARIDLSLVERVLPSLECDFYVCAPAKMIGELTRGLRSRGVAEGAIHIDQWGSVSPPAVVEVVNDASPIEVTFRRSGKVCRWDPTAPSLLDFAADNGVQMAASCRSGSCGACLTTTSGSVRYLREPGAPPAPGTCLACIAVPVASMVIDA